jgi:hypothetical protein
MLVLVQVEMLSVPENRLVLFIAANFAEELVPRRDISKLVEGGAGCRIGRLMGFLVNVNPYLAMLRVAVNMVSGRPLRLTTQDWLKNWAG